MENLMDAFGVTDALQLQRRIDQLQLEIAKTKGGEKIPTTTASVPKNHKPSTAHAGRTYVRLTDALGGGGCIPQQQADIANILIRGMEKGAAYTEEYVFGILLEHAAEYVQLRTSKQDATFLFRYYRGLKKPPKHFGYITRGFLRQIG
jgi:hypothetical protein